MSAPAASTSTSTSFTSTSSSHSSTRSCYSVSLVINSELDLHNLLQKVMKEARELLGADRCSMYVCDHAKGELWSSVADGYHGVIRMPIGQGIAGKCAQTGEIINVKNAEEDNRVDVVLLISVNHT